MLNKYSDKGEIEESINDIAYTLSILLKDENNRKILENEIKLSDKVENILEASEFLNKSRDIKINGKLENSSFAKVMSDCISKDKSEKFYNKIKNLDFGLIDIYFPIKEHRENWKSSDELLIAAVYFRDEKDQSKILAYDLNGNEVFIEPNVLPDIPTLVVYPSEKRGSYKKDNISSEFYSTLQTHSAVATNLNENPTPPPIWYGSYVDHFKIDGFYDGWLEGEMEIYARVRTRENSSSNWSNWTDIKWLDENYEEGTWRNSGHYIFYSQSIYAQYQIQIWDCDGLFCDDDLIAGENWALYEYISPTQSGGYLFNITDLNINNYSFLKGDGGETSLSVKPNP